MGLSRVAVCARRESLGPLRILHAANDSGARDVAEELQACLAINWLGHFVYFSLTLTFDVSFFWLIYGK